MEQAAPSYRIIQGESASACLSQSWLSQTFSVVAFIMHGAQGQSQSTKYDTKRSIESFAATLFFFSSSCPTRCPEVNLFKCRFFWEPKRTHALACTLQLALWCLFHLENGNHLQENYRPQEGSSFAY